MQTTPPMLMASAAKAGAVHPMTRNMAHVAIKVAIAIPEIGLDEVPIRPVMRDETVTNKKPKTTTSKAAKMLLKADVGAPGTGLKVSMSHMSAIKSAAPTRAHLRLMSCSVRRRPAAPAA